MYHTIWQYTDYKKKQTDFQIHKNIFSNPFIQNNDTGKLSILILIVFLCISVEEMLTLKARLHKAEVIGKDMYKIDHWNLAIQV